MSETYLIEFDGTPDVARLHGPFLTQEEANAYVLALRAAGKLPREFAYSVVPIETPWRVHCYNCAALFDSRGLAGTYALCGACRRERVDALLAALGGGSAV